MGCVNSTPSKKSKSARSENKKKSLKSLVRAVLGKSKSNGSISPETPPSSSSVDSTNGVATSPSRQSSETLQKIFCSSGTSSNDESDTSSAESAVNPEVDGSSVDVAKVIIEEKIVEAGKGEKVKETSKTDKSGDLADSKPSDRKELTVNKDETLLNKDSVKDDSDNLEDCQGQDSRKVLAANTKDEEADVTAKPAKDKSHDLKESKDQGPENELAAIEEDKEVEVKAKPVKDQRCDMKDNNDLGSTKELFANRGDVEEIREKLSRVLRGELRISSDQELSKTSVTKQFVAEEDVTPCSDQSSQLLKFHESYGACAAKVIEGKNTADKVSMHIHDLVLAVQDLTDSPRRHTSMKKKKLSGLLCSRSKSPYAKVFGEKRKCYKKRILQFWLQRCRIIDEIKSIKNELEEQKTDLEMYRALTTLQNPRRDRFKSLKLQQSIKRLHKDFCENKIELYDLKRELATTEAKLDRYINKFSPELKFVDVYYSTRKSIYLSPIPEESKLDLEEYKQGTFPSIRNHSLAARAVRYGHQLRDTATSTDF